MKKSNFIKRKLLSIKYIRYFHKGKIFLNDPYFLDAQAKSIIEKRKNPSRTDLINYILSCYNEETNYLEIGVRNPDHNFNHITANRKYSVDPGFEFEENPVDYKMTSDDFFDKLNDGKILSPDIKFNVIFIDGLHTAEQVNRDIENSLNFIKEDGFIILHDCNPPTEWHTRITYNYSHTPALGDWNGTTWKAFLKWRCNPSVHACCIDSDWGLGIISKKVKIGNNIEKTNLFFEFNELEANRVEYLNLIDFDSFKKILN